MNTNLDSYLSSTLVTWEHNAKLRTTDSFYGNISILRNIISNSAIDNPTLARFLLDAHQKPNQAERGGIMNKQVIEDLQKYRQVSSFKELFQKVTPASSLISKPSYSSSGHLTKSFATQAAFSAPATTPITPIALKATPLFTSKVATPASAAPQAAAAPKPMAFATQAASPAPIVLKATPLFSPTTTTTVAPKATAPAPTATTLASPSAMFKATPLFTPKAETPPAAVPQKPPTAATQINKAPVAPQATPVASVAAKAQPTEAASAPSFKLNGPFMTLPLIPRPGHDKPIVADIANVGHLAPLAYDKFGDLFALFNEHTLNKAYPCQNTSKLIAGIMVHRANHNGTHSARQVRYLEAICDCIAKHGNYSTKELLKQFTPQEMLHLRLAAYLMRAGRVDESEHKADKPDNYNERSAQIYNLYARQLTGDAKLILDTRNLIEYSCVPWDKCPKIQGNKKAQLAHAIIASIHEMDLLRCFGPDKVDVNSIPATKSRLQHLGISGHQVDNLYEYAKKSLDSTGSFRVYDGKGGDSKLFADCSVNGKKCWQQVSSVAFPSTWN